MPQKMMPPLSRPHHPRLCLIRYEPNVSCFSAFRSISPLDAPFALDGGGWMMIFYPLALPLLPETQHYCCCCCLMAFIVLLAFDRLCVWPEAKAEAAQQQQQHVHEQRTCVYPSGRTWSRMRVPSDLVLLLSLFVAEKHRAVKKEHYLKCCQFYVRTA